MFIIVRRVLNWLRRVFYFLLFVLVSTVFFSALHYYLSTAQFAAIALICGPVLALLFGFSALLYGRTRALLPGLEQKRSLYAAERALQAAILFMVAVALGGIISIPMWMATIGAKTPVSPMNNTLIWFFAPMLLALFSFACFFLALRTVSHRMLRWMTLRELAKRLRNGL